METRAAQSREIQTFRAVDGAELAYVAFRPEKLNPRRSAFVYLHGIESHAGWFEAAAGLLCGRGYPVFCLDRRGSGINRENRGFASGHVPRGIDLLEDIRGALREIRGNVGVETVYLIGLSWGGKCAAAYDVRHPGDVDGLVLITPGIVPKVDLVFFDKCSILADLFIDPGRRRRIPIEPEMFSDSPRHLEFIRNDPLRLHSVSAAFLWQSRRMDRLLKRAKGSAIAPVVVFLAGKDRIIDNEATRRFLAGKKGIRATVIEYPDQTHSIQLDAPERLVRDVIEWVERLNC
jgi:alpha-beta hydrolase superfamily lysophospholipase